jgi:hypothetical protein
MADLNFTQGADPVAIFNDTTGNQLAVNSDGSILTVDMSHEHFHCENKEMFATTVELNLPTSGTETNIGILVNPTGETKRIFIYKWVALLTNTVGSIATLRFYIQPTITANGTAQSIFNTYIGDSAASIANVYKSPTTSAKGTFAFAVNVQGGTGGATIIDDMNGILAIPPGMTMLMTGTPDGTNRNIIVTFYWAEE